MEVQEPAYPEGSTTSIVSFKANKQRFSCSFPPSVYTPCKENPLWQPVYTISLFSSHNQEILAASEGWQTTVFKLSLLFTSSLTLQGCALNLTHALP